MAGAEVGLDVYATVSLYRRKATPDYVKGVLRSILAGSIHNREKLHKARVVDSPVCKYCNTGMADLHSFYSY